MKQAKLALITLLIFVIVLRLLVLFTYDAVYWDEAVYVGMGKYLFSGGVEGFTEWIRPPIIPMITGALDAMGLPPLFAGRIIMLLASVLSVFIFYKILRRRYAEQQALIGAAVFSLIPLVTVYSVKLLGESLLILFIVLAVYAIEKKHWLWTGVLLGLAFQTKFLAGIFVISFAIWQMLGMLNKKNRREHFHIALISASGFLIVTAPYLIFNWIVFNNPIASIVLAFDVVQKIITCERTSSPLIYYGTQIFIQIPLAAMIILGLRKKGQKLKDPATYWVISILLALLFFSRINCVDERYLLLSIPMLLLLLLRGWELGGKVIKKSGKSTTMWWVLLMLCSILWILLTQSLTFPPPLDDQVAQEWFSQVPNSSGVSATPYVVLGTDAQIIPLYYDTFPRTNYTCADYDWILVNTCTIDHMQWKAHCQGENPINPTWIKDFRGVRTLDWNGCHYVLYKHI